MWTVRVLTADVMNAATSGLRGLFPGGAQPWTDLSPAGPQPGRASAWTGLSLDGPQPCRIQLSGGSDPEGADSAGGWCWQSHQVPPGQSS
jgi:hypothetical protein